MMRRTKIDLVYDDTLALEDPAHPLRQFQKVLFSVITPTDSRLIGDHKDQIAEPVGGATKLKDAINKFKIFRLANICVIYVDHAIAIQKQGGATAQWYTPPNSIWARA